MSDNVVEACTSYSVCGLLMTIQEIDWMTLGAIVLLVARLVKDVPDAYDAIVDRINKRRNNVQSK